MDCEGEEAKGLSARCSICENSLLLQRSALLTIPYPLPMSPLNAHAGIPYQIRISVLAREALNIMQTTVEDL